MWKSGIAVLAASGWAGMAAAQSAPVETFLLDGIEVRVTVHPFLTEEELLTLRLVGQSREALGLFVTEAAGYSALAIAPDEGFVRAGMPVDSAVALSGLPSMEAAQAAAMEGCDALRNGGLPCVIVLEVAPN